MKVALIPINHERSDTKVFPVRMINVISRILPRNSFSVQSKDREFRVKQSFQGLDSRQSPGGYLAVYGPTAGGHAVAIGFA